MSLEAMEKIKENYKRMETDYVNQLFFETSHGSTTGRYREQIWGKMFESIVPKKFVIEQSVFIIDSEGSISNEVDLAIFDEMYTPYVFRYEEIKFIPIEAVAAVVECKSTSMDKEALKNWTDSIEKLKTSEKSFVRINNGIVCGTVKSQTATRPLRILCCLNQKHKDLLGDCFDVTIRAGGEKLEIEWSSKRESLYDWYTELNHAQGGEEQDSKPLPQVKNQKLDSYEVKLRGEKLSLMTFNFQFNQVLMLINNPMLFPHIAYAEMFNGKIGEEAKKEGES
ncbi:hypothetical protein LIZ09_03670 [Tyzzerella nexilis]|nr:hypothetical protein [[Clostridium] nexile]MCB7556543.1 hypothetical protein [[Clostridium] nexile]NSD84934.1 hypothetical protein [[Clostridium] nexile]NSD87319.1 hypothetical protein [[Clostridium] nexile]